MHKIGKDAGATVARRRFDAPFSRAKCHFLACIREGSANDMLNSQFKLQGGLGSAGTSVPQPLALRKALTAMNSAAGHSGQRLTPGFTFEILPRFGCSV
jgi:hypothetical protein